MNLKKIIKISFFLFVFQLNAQESIVVSGSNAVGSNGNISYTVGQVIYTTNFSSTGSSAQGIQQPYEIQALSLDDFNFHFVVFPNPTSDFLTLNIKNYEYDSLRYEFYDLNGRLILSNNIISENTILKMQDYASSIYFLKILNKNKEIKSYKIYKN